VSAALLLSIFVASASAQPAAVLIPAESDERLLWSCSPEEQRRLRGLVIAASRGRHAHQAWLVVQEYLCSSSSDTRTLRDHLPERVAVGHDNAYSPDHAELAPASALKARGGRAWGAHAENTGSDIQLSYASNEVCSVWVTLRYRRA
jgi:hypothetical protein